MTTTDARAALGPRADLSRARRSRRSPPRSKASTPTSTASARSTTSSTSASVEPREPTERRRHRARRRARPRRTSCTTELRPVDAYLLRARHHRQPQRSRRRAARRAADPRRAARPARASGSARGSRRSTSTTLAARSHAAAEHDVRAAQGGRGRRAPDERARRVARRRARAVGRRSRGSACTATSRRSSSSTIARPDGTAERVPMAFARGLATHPDAARRRAAYEGELAAWATVAVPLAAALNGAKGELGVLEPAPRLRRRPRARAALQQRRPRHARRDDRRGRRRRCPTSARYLRAKARLLGHDGGLPWWDLFAPVGHAGDVAWTARDRPRARRVRRLLARARGARRPRVRPSSGSTPRSATASAAARTACRRRRRRQPRDDELRRQPRLGVDARARARPRVPQRHARRAHADAAPAADGARRDRVDLLRDAALRARGRAAPPTTPSGWRCSTRTSSARPRSSSTSTAASCSRPSCAGAGGARPFGGRAERPRCSTRRRRAYGDGLHPDHRHQYMWAVKPHYFTPFYNWPYTFGLLFGIGLYARYRRRPRALPRRLRRPAVDGRAWPTPPRSPARFGFDVRDGAFWAESLAVLERHIDDHARAAASV